MFWQYAACTIWLSREQTSSNGICVGRLILLACFHAQKTKKRGSVRGHRIPAWRLRRRWLTGCKETVRETTTQGPAGVQGPQGAKGAPAAARGVGEVIPVNHHD